MKYEVKTVKVSLFCVYATDISSSCSEHASFMKILKFLRWV